MGSNPPKINLPSSHKEKTVGSPKVTRSPGGVSLSGSSPGTTGGHMWPGAPEGTYMVPVLLKAGQKGLEGGVEDIELLSARIEYLEAALLRAEANILELRGMPISGAQRQNIENRAAAAHRKVQARQQSH